MVNAGPRSYSYSGGAPPAPIREPVRNGYTRARAWLDAKPIAREKISRQRRSTYRRIAKLGDTWGLKLEELGAPFGVLRWVADPVNRSLPETEARYRLAVEALESAARRGVPLSDREVRALLQSRPKVERKRNAGAEEALARAADAALPGIRRAELREQLRKAG